MKLLLALLAFTALASALLFGPAGFRPGPQSAEAAFLSEIKKLLASDAQASDNFGISVAPGGAPAIAGARLQDAAGGASVSGAAYVFQEPLPTPTPTITSTATSTSTPTNTPTATSNDTSRTRLLPIFCTSRASIYEVARHLGAVSL